MTSLSLLAGKTVPTTVSLLPNRSIHVSDGKVSMVYFVVIRENHPGTVSIKSGPV